MKITELALATHISVKTIRHYERLALLHLQKEAQMAIGSTARKT